MGVQVGRSSTGKPVARDETDVNENTESSSQVWHQNANTRSRIEKQVARMLNRLSETRLTHHNFQTFNVRHFEKLCSRMYDRN